MKKRTTVILLGALILVAGVFTVLAFGSPARGLAADQAMDKIEPLLLDKFSAEGQADFIVMFTEQADLSPAYTMGWKERGEFVYNTLKETASRTQAQAKAYLDSRTLAYTTFIAGNELYVHTGDQTAALSLAKLLEVGYIRATRVYQVDPVEVPNSVYASYTWPGELVMRSALVTVAAAPGVAQAPLATFDWGITDAAADQFWSNYGLEGDGIVVANIDTGVDYTHDALEPNYKCGAAGPHTACWLDPGTQNCSGPGGGPCDTIYAGIYHGTHTMGTMAADNDPALAYTVGMAPNAQWIACLGCPNGSCPDFDLNTCADWMLAPGGDPANRPHIVNNSWGGGGGDPWYLPKVDAWRADGIFPAFSAGNSYTCNSLGSPGDYQESFGSASHKSGRQISSFSSKGPSVYGHTPYTKPNISAPGENIRSTAPGNSWAVISGTSMASPHTAGAVALLWSCSPSLVGQIDLTFQALQNATDVPPAGSCGAPPDGEGNYTYGYGYLNANTLGLNNCGAAETGTLQGTVTDADTAAPIVGALVDAGGGFTDTTDGSGFYQIPNMPAGTYNVTASATGYNSSVANGVVVNAGQTTTQDFALTPVTGCTDNCLRVTAIQLQAGANSTNARVTVKDEHDVAVSSAAVYVHWDYPGGTSDMRKRTNASGLASFRLAVTSPGTYTITVTNITKTSYTFDPDGSIILSKSITR